MQPGLLQPGQGAGDGWIPCFRAPGDRWSFVRCGANRRAEEVRGKNRISELATVGFCWFSSAARYVAPLYKQLIAEALEVTATEIPFGSVTPLGTPDEVSLFLTG